MGQEAMRDRPSRADVERTLLTTSRDRGWLAGVFFVAGAFVALVAALDPSSHRLILVGVAVAAGVVGVVAVVLRDRFTYLATLLTSMLGPPMIAIGIVAGRGGWSSVALMSLCTFVAVHTALVLRRSAAAGMIVWSAATAGAAGVIVSPHLPLVPLLVVLLVVCATLSGVTSWLMERMQRLAATDPLTGVANRTTFQAALELATAAVSRTGEPLSLIAIDLDDFKAVNDTHGHAAGDQILIAATCAWHGALRARDVLARLGGDEFAAILPGSDAAEAARIAERLRKAMPPDTYCSTGRATWTHGQQTDELLIAADRDLYRTKRGRQDHDPTPTGIGKSWESTGYSQERAIGCGFQ